MARREYKVETAYRYPDFAAFQAAEPAAAEWAANALRRLIEDAVETAGTEQGCERAV